MTDACAGWIVPYVARVRVLPALTAGQALFSRQRVLAVDAGTILGGGENGTAVAQRHGVHLAVVIDGCGTRLADVPGTTIVERGSNLSVYELRAS